MILKLWGPVASGIGSAPGWVNVRVIHAATPEVAQQIGMALFMGVLGNQGMPRLVAVDDHGNETVYAEATDETVDS